MQQFKHDWLCFVANTRSPDAVVTGRFLPADPMMRPFLSMPSCIMVEIAARESDEFISSVFFYLPDPC